MDTYQAIIIDDERNLCEALEIMLKQNCPNVMLCGIANSAKVGRQLLAENKVDLIFLDIKMPGEDGFAFLNTISAEDYAVIFTTAYQEFALKAIKANAIAYLLKPINSEDLQVSVNKAISYLVLRKNKEEVKQLYNESLNNLRLQLKDSSLHTDKITIFEQSGFRILEVKLIRYLEADGNYTIIHLSGLDKIVSTKSLGEFGKILDQPVFFRIHKSFIINMNYLKGYSNYQGSFAIIDDNTKLSISRRRINEFKQLINYFSKSIV
ncbi:MAG: LytTR family DNA-binding domain-containing protein [Bacteroidetes bacterium]|nr:LytTR family DNA-binding domain-containing protein [Bacteroidota bacterium]